MRGNLFFDVHLTHLDAEQFVCVMLRAMTKL